jgi:hypothetical protein
LFTCVDGTMNASDFRSAFMTGFPTEWFPVRRSAST